MMRRTFTGLVAVGLTTLTVAAFAQPPADPPSTDLRAKQQQNADRFRRLKEKLLALAQRLDTSDNPADKQRAKAIYSALDVAAREKIDEQFRSLVGEVSKGSETVTDLQRMVAQDAQLSKALQDMLAVLTTDDESSRTKAEILKLEEAIKEARAIRRNQESIRALADAQKGNAEDLAKSQRDLAARTKELADRMAGPKKGADVGKKDGKPGDKDAKGDKSDGKGDKADGKDAKGNKSESKDGKGAKSDGKEGKADGKDAKSGAKDGKADGKDAAGKKSDGKPNAGKDKAGKDGGKDAKGNKDDAKDAKGDPKGKSVESPKGENKNKDGSKDAAKGDPGKPKEGTKSPPQKGAKGSDQQPPGGQQQQAPKPRTPGQPPPPPDQLPGRKFIEEAYPHQKAAQKDLEKGDRAEAGKNADQAIDELNKAIQELEKRLKQLREQEAVRLLAGLEARCLRMLDMQRKVLAATKDIDEAARKAGEMATAEIQKAQQQSDEERKIVAEADTTLKLIQSEGSAVAFGRILEEVRQDMVVVEGRLGSAAVGADTQQIEAGIVAMLDEMVKALARQKQEMKEEQQKQQNQPPPPSGGPPPNRALVNLLAELKLLRALQQQINERTKTYGAKSPGEQAADPRLQAELRQLAARQQKLHEMLNAIASGANK